MNYKQKYLKALEQHKYNDLLNIIFENFIEKFDYKSLSDLGSFLSDIGHGGAKIELNEESCFSLGKKLVEYSYFSHPDIHNGFALQLICLEKSKDYQTVCTMMPTAKALKSGPILNNIALSKYYLNEIDEALQVQKDALKLNFGDERNNQIAKYNFLLYSLFCSTEKMKNINCANDILHMLISEDVFEYESAMALAAYANQKDFIENHMKFFNETFIIPNNLKHILNCFLKYGTKPSLAELKPYLKPLTICGSNFYLTA